MTRKRKASRSGSARDADRAGRPNGKAKRARAPRTYTVTYTQVPSSPDRIAAAEQRLVEILASLLDREMAKKKPPTDK